MGKKFHRNIPSIPELEEFVILASSCRAALERGNVALALQGVREIEATADGWRFAAETIDRRKMSGVQQED